MCDIKEGFKLCTCHEVDEEETHWKLIRFRDGIISVIGEVSEEYYQDLMKYGWIEKELNQRNCFEFECTPQNGDRLLIELKGANELTLCFDYSDEGSSGGWKQNSIFDNEGGELNEKGRIITLYSYDEITDILTNELDFSSRQIYDLESSVNSESTKRIKKIYGYFANNLQRIIYKKGYRIQKSFVFIHSGGFANTAARTKNGYYFIQISHELISKFSNVLGYLDIKSFDNQLLYKSIQDKSSDSLNDLLEHFLIQFTFYHEFAHLVQYSVEGVVEKQNSKSNVINRISRQVQNEEVDADYFGARFLAEQIHYYLKYDYEGVPSEEELIGFLGLVGATLFIYFLAFDDIRLVLHYDPNQYPHPAIRIINALEAFIDSFSTVSSLSEYTKEYLKNHINRESLTIAKHLIIEIYSQEDFNYLRNLYMANFDGIISFGRKLREELNSYEFSAIKEKNRLEALYDQSNDN